MKKFVSIPAEVHQYDFNILKSNLYIFYLKNFTFFFNKDKTLLFKFKIFFFQLAAAKTRSVIVIVVGKVTGDPSSNPWWGCLYFT